jgi:uncharacterized membrane protein YphA (DoxX/SURF4 family)
VSASIQNTKFVLAPLRVVTGWMFLSAFHRRVLLDADKLVFDAPGYVGLKFNQFMPGAILGVDSMIAALLDNPSALHAFLWTFTIIEGLVGLALMLGLGTRLAALGMTLLSAGILFGAGWLGPTCLDEWQIGAMGIASGMVLLLGGAGGYSLDAWLRERRPGLFERRWIRWAADPVAAPSPKLAAGLTVIALLITLGTNQVFHSGLWGPLHNDSVRPKVVVHEATMLADGELELELERPAGPETYGAFIVAVRVLDEHDAIVRSYDEAALAAITEDRIENRWLVRVRPGPHGLVVPLGARAIVQLAAMEPALGVGAHRVELEDVSGVRWTAPIEQAGTGLL